MTLQRAVMTQRCDLLAVIFENIIDEFLSPSPLLLYHRIYIGIILMAQLQETPLRCSSSMSICVPPRETTMATSKSFSSYLECTAKSSDVHPNSSSFHEELSNIIYSCFFTLTVVQNRVRSNQLNVSHFVIQCQLYTAIAQPGNSMPPM